MPSLRQIAGAGASLVRHVDRRARPATRPLRALAAARDGIAAVEFAIVLPIFLMLFVGVVDLGGALFMRFRLDAAAASSTGYALTRAADVSAKDGEALARSIAALARSDAGSNVATVSVDINNGPTATATGQGTVAAAAGNKARADQCYCPTAAPFAWGAATATCTTACGGGVNAGKFVRVTISRPYDALFSSYGLVSDGVIAVTSTVQTQ